MKLIILPTLLASSPTIPLITQSTGLVAIHSSKILVLLGNFSDFSSKNVFLTSRVFSLCLSHGTCEINLLNQISKLEVRPHHSTFALWKQITQYLNSKPRVWIISFTFKSLYSFPVYSRIQPHCALYLSHHHDSTCPIMNRKHSVRRNKS